MERDDYFCPQDDGQQAFHADMQQFQREEEEALRRVIKGTATLQDAEILAHATGHDFKQLLKEAA